MFASILSWIYSALDTPFDVLESVYGYFGLSFLTIFTVMIVSGFVVSRFMQPFFR